MMATDKSNFRKVRFTWDSERYFDGWADGTTWNGFLNVEVEPEVHEEVKAHFAQFEDFNAEDWDLPPTKYGTISYANGFATYEDE